MYILNGGYWHREAGGGPTTSSATYVIGLGVMVWLSLVGSELEAEAKNREAGIDQVLTVLG